jgi:hypothetical protein
MNTLQEFLIKSAGMEKASRTALAKRLLASTMTPQEVVKRFGKVKGNRYLDDIATAVKNYVNTPAVDTSAPYVDQTRDYLRFTFDRNMAKPLYFSNRISKSDLLKPSKDNSIRSNNIAYPDWLDIAGSRSGLSGLYNTLPRQDKLIVSKYLRGIVPESGIQHLSKDVKRAAQEAKSLLLETWGRTYIPPKSRYAKTLQQQYGIIPRDTLAEHITKVIPGYDTSKLTHQNYVIGSRSNLSNKDMLMAATQLPYTDSMHLPVQRAVLDDISRSRSELKLNKKNSYPRSVQKALELIKGQNVLEPGTHANRMFNKIYARPELRKKLDLPDKSDLREYELAQNAFYDPITNTIAVSPKWGKHYDTVSAHESGHFTSYNAPADEHAEHAYKTLRRMKAVANNNKFNLPLYSPRLMQEALAESYIPKILGKTVIAPRTSYISNLIRDIRMLPKSLLDDRRNIFQMSRNKYAIDHMKGTEADKELFRQLALNYGHNLLL